MIHEKCKNCSELVIPYFGFHRKPNRELSEKLKMGTCKCNVDEFDKKGEGYYGYCHPDECKGPGHRYYLNYDMLNGCIKFID